MTVTCTSENIAAICCLELCDRWRALVTDIPVLSQAIQILSFLPDTRSHAAMALVMWSTGICEMLANVVGMLERVGKAPKERVCVKTTGLTPSGIRAFLHLVVKFLKQLTTSAVEEGSVGLQCDEHWQEPILPSTSEPKGHSAVLDIHSVYSGDQVHVSPLNAPLLTAHVQLALVCDMILGFELRSIKPLSLFPLATRAAFFTKLIADVTPTEQSVATSALASDDVQHDLLALRRSFFQTALPLIVRADAEGDQRHLSLPKFISLAQQMGIEQDSLRSQMTLNLYECGLDARAEESLQLAENQTLISEQLLMLVREQVALQFQSSSKYSELVAELPMDTVDWLSESRHSAFVHVPDAVMALASLQQLVRRLLSRCETNSPRHTECVRLQTVIEVMIAHS
jgi:Rab3 GTPase-activating protein non-catalytic subunit